MAVRPKAPSIVPPKAMLPLPVLTVELPPNGVVPLVIVKALLVVE